MNNFTDESPEWINAREHMVLHQLRGRDIVQKSVLDAMRAVPRHLFVSAEYRQSAYADGPLPIGCNQTISQPYIVALMTQELQLSGSEKVLEIGTGSGYQAAVLACLSRQVHTIERHPALAENAAALLSNLGYNNVHVHIGDGSLGLLEEAPFEAIIVTAAAPVLPQNLLDQLSPGGRLILPVGGRGTQVLELWQRQGDDFINETILSVAFVPLVGRFGWKE